jgi:hypothetical protein
VVLAELEAFFSRPIAPTRRVALGRLNLPFDPAPGFGGLLLGGIAAAFGPELDEDWHADVERLMSELERGRRIAQPRLRHRLQQDRIGLQPCHHRLLGTGERVEFDLARDQGTPAQHVLCAVYAAGGAPWQLRPTVMDSVRKGFRWRNGTGPALVAHLSGRSSGLSTDALGDPVAWAMQVLDLSRVHDGLPTRRDVQQAFRRRLRDAHPDHGAEDVGAAKRIAELSEARRILLG